MRLNTKAASLLALTAALFLGSCQKEVGHIGSPDPQPVLPTPITATLSGNVVDENGAPASGVTVKVGGRTVSTDNRGYFRLTGAALDKNQSLVTAEKSGYFKAYRSFAATSGANQVMIKLLPRTVAGNVDAVAGGEASLANGSKVALPAGGIVNAATGAAYTGSVKVYAAYIDPTAADFGGTVPGSLMANDKTGKRVVLTSYGMLAVELEGASGEKLQIKSGAKARLTTVIPAAGTASAPASIPMWYVDETTGIWKEEGSATKQGNAYVGEVPHFSFWNCDVPENFVNLSLTLKTNDNAPLVNARVRLTRTGQYSSSANGFTDSLGQVSGAVPINAPLQLEVLDECGNVVYTQNVGPFSQNTTLPAITVTPSGQAFSTISGKLLDCNNAPVTNGYAIIAVNNLVRYVATDAQGRYSTNVLTCTGSNVTVSVVGVDNSTQQQSSGTSAAYASPATSVADISICNGTSTAQFINFQLDGTSYSITSTATSDSLTYFSMPDSSGGSARSYIMGSRRPGAGNNDNISFMFFHSANPVPGPFNMMNIQVNNYQQNVMIQPSTVTVTAFPTVVGTFIEGSFTGSFREGGATPTHTVSGTFRLRKTF
ncbi:carboxypeptidase-like regulatory domain-containing protein [Flaviaesturariibacter amylovorans]|uniref:Carboxypeptidase regulatory-like domain-containing protein n=1 Tax=Flaviaesturariibacter amylovorans TaxID=1084520 RepID=A0ABP8HQF5_9BACT